MQNVCPVSLFIYLFIYLYIYLFIIFFQKHKSLHSLRKEVSTKMKISV